MVRFNFWDKFLGRKPKTFRKDTAKQIKENTLFYLQQHGRGRWVSVEDVFKGTLEESDLWKSEEGKMIFAESGIRNKINGATHTLRREGYPIISGKGKKGYKYADEDCETFIHDWDEKISGWVSRKDGLIQEYRTDKILIERIIEKLLNAKREAEANKLKEILVKYTKNREKVKEEVEDKDET